MLRSAPQKPDGAKLYQDAMNVISAEQKQLDWLGDKIRTIQSDHDAKIAHLEGLVKDIDDTSVKFASTLTDAQKKELASEKKDYWKMEEAEIPALADVLAPWQRKYDDQLKRVEDARARADALSPK